MAETRPNPLELVCGDGGAHSASTYQHRALCTTFHYCARDGLGSIGIVISRNHLRWAAIQQRVSQPTELVEDPSAQFPAGVVGGKSDDQDNWMLKVRRC